MLKGIFTKNLLIFLAAGLISSCATKQYSLNLIDKNPNKPQFAQHQSAPQEYTLPENTQTELAIQKSAPATKYAVIEDAKSTKESAPAMPEARKKSPKKIGLFHPASNFMATKTILKQVKEIKTHQGITEVKGGINGKMKQGIILIAVGLLIMLFGGIIGWGLGWVGYLFYVIGAIVFVVGCIIVLMEILEM